MDLTRADFGALLASGALSAIGASIPRSAKADAIAWTSDNEYLSENFAPVQRELDAGNLPVIAGRIPPDLSGVYMRNGPNPLFKPITYTYPLDGDGMIHAVYLDNGRARYRNRFVQTSSLAIEKRAGRAVYGGFAHPIPIDPSLLRAGDTPSPFKNGAFIHIIRHAGRFLALDETRPCYEMTIDLDTIGLWKAGTEKPLLLGAHNRLHPRTGTLFTLAYSVKEPVVHIHQIDSAGNLRETFPLTLAAPTMIHDFILTERHVVIVGGPAIFDVAAAQAGQSMLQWRPHLGTRILVAGLDGDPVVSLEAEPYFVYHFANGFERSAEIVIDYVRHERFGLGGGPTSTRPASMHQMRIDLTTKSIRDVQLPVAGVEFPRVNDDLNALPTRFVYLPTRSKTLRASNPPDDTFNVILRVETQSGEVVRHDFGNRIAGEAAFIPRGSSREDDGYLALFAFDPANGTSDFVLLDAAHVDAEPVAVLRLPQRVPQGLHGSWIPRS